MKLSLQKVNTCKYGLNTFRCYGPNISKSLHDDLSNAPTIRIFVCQIRNMTFDTCNRPFTVFDAILTSRQTREKLQCLYENLMLNNFRKTAVLNKISIVN